MLFRSGRELTVGVMGDRALAVTEIIANAGAFYDYESKYADGGSHHVIPARVHPRAYAHALDVAVAAHNALALACGYGFGTMFRVGEGARRAITFETGIHNTALGLTLVFTFFPSQTGMMLVALPQA